MMTTPYPNGTEPNSYPWQVPQPPAANYSQVPQPPAVHDSQAPQPAPFGQNPGKSPGKASFGCGVAGLVLFGVVIVSRALRLNAIPVVVVIAAVLLFFLLSVLLSSAYGF